MLCNPSGSPQRLDVDITGLEQLYAVGSCRPDGAACIAEAQSFAIYACNEPG